MPCIARVVMVCSVVRGGGGVEALARVQSPSKGLVGGRAGQRRDGACRRVRDGCR